MNLTRSEKIVLVVILLSAIFVAINEYKKRQKKDTENFDLVSIAKQVQQKAESVQDMLKQKV
jgi:hypothetical protein